MHPAFSHDRFVLERRVIALTGRFRIYDTAGNLCIYSRQKMLPLRGDIRAYSDETCAQELFSIRARHAIKFAAAYDVYDSMSGELAGTLRRQGLRSIKRDEWQVLSPDQRITGILQEDTLAPALLRRVVVGGFLPQKYVLKLYDRRAADIRQRFNPLRYILDIHFHMDTDSPLDRRLGLAAGILLAAIERRQE